jgi:tetratricopeptide (TPR) repeat protein
MAGELSKAQKLLRARRFRQVIRLLEPQVFRFRQSFPYFYTLGLASLYAGDFAGAASYLERARGLGDDERVLAALAAVQLARNQKEECLKTWLEVIDRWPRNRQARRGLLLLRRGGEPSELAGRRRLMRSLYPPLPRRVAPVLFACVAAAAVAAGAYAAVRYMPPPGRSDLPDLSLPASPLISPSSKDTLYVLSEKDVRRTFDKAKSLLLSYRDNEACVELNRLLLSNAGPAVRDRAAMLKSYVRGPDFAHIGRTYSWQETSVEPRLYDGCFVVWRGRVANYHSDASGARFDFLVGYERGTELLGIVPATLSFAADIASGDNLEVIGKLLVGEGRSLRLQVTSLRQIVPK